jgi:hypothetical protein
MPLRGNLHGLESSILLLGSDSENGSPGAARVFWQNTVTVPSFHFEHMPLAVLPQPFSHPDWIFELKYDGFRALAQIDNGVELISRKGIVYKSFGNLCSQIFECLKVDDAVLDGEGKRELSVAVRKLQAVALGNPVMPVADGFLG